MCLLDWNARLDLTECFQVVLMWQYLPAFLYKSAPHQSDREGRPSSAQVWALAGRDNTLISGGEPRCRRRGRMPWGMLKAELPLHLSDQSLRGLC